MYIGIWSDWDSTSMLASEGIKEENDQQNNLQAYQQQIKKNLLNNLPVMNTQANYQNIISSLIHQFSHREKYTM